MKLQLTTLLIFSVLASAASAEDKVVLLLKGGSSRITISGTIVDYTGRSIQIRPRAGMAVKTYPTSQVLEVHTSQSTAHSRGLELLADYRTREAVLNFEKAIALEPRTWVRRELLALLIQCETRLQDYAGAGSHFRLLAKSDANSNDFKLIPLFWAREILKEEARKAATGWILTDSDIDQLIGASWLLFNSKYSEMASNTLKELSTSTDERVRLLAKAQLWRLQLRGRDISRFELQRWESRIERMPEELRGGPYYLLGAGHLLRQEHERAAAALLWTALVYDFDHQLAARACLKAAETMKQLGQKDEAKNLFREVAIRFRDTSYAQDASQAIASGG